MRKIAIFILLIFLVGCGQVNNKPSKKPSNIEIFNIPDTNKVIVGGDDANGNFDPYQITYVFNLVGTGYSATDNYVVVGNFDCEYKYYTFDYDPIVQMKVKKLKLSIPCRIALKLE